MTFLDFERYSRLLMGEHVSIEEIRECYSRYVASRQTPCDLDEERDKEKAA